MTTARRGVYTHPNIWDQCADLEVYRGGEKLDPGANYFVFMLDQLGMPTYYSCEGHPYGFYVMFSAPYKDALEISKIGYFTVEMAGREKNRWSITMNLSSGVGHEGGDAERMRVDWLRHAAEAWEKAVGPLDLDAVKLNA